MSRCKLEIVWSCTSWVTQYWVWWMVFHCCRWSVFYCFFSYLTVLELHYEGRVWRSWVAQEQAKEMGTSVIESEHRIDVELFLNKYPQWELGTPHWSVILHMMFLHAVERGWKEAECMVCWGHQGSTLEPDPEAGHSTMELVGYRTSHKEIKDIYQSVYLLWRPTGLPCCGDQLRRRTIWDILSSLKDWLHRCRYPAAAGEDPEPQEGWWSRPNRWEPYEEALRAACQRALDTAEALQGDIERLSWRARDRSWTHSWTHSQSWSRSCSRSRRRSCSRACSQSHPWNSSQSRQSRSPNGPLPGRRVMFREPEVRPNFEGSVEDYSSEPSVSDVEIWLEWQAQQLGTPAWWSELEAILGVEDPWELTCKIRASFYIPEVRMRAFLEQVYTVPPAPKCLNRNAFLPDELSYQDVWQQPILLTIAYARGLQYWAEKLNPPRSLDLHPLAGSVVELRETVQEYVTFDHWDVVQGLGVIHLGSTSQWPQTTLFIHMLSLLVEGQDFMEAITHTTSPIAEEDMTRCTTLPSEAERESWYLLVVTASMGQLNLGPSGNNCKRSTVDPHNENTFWNPWMAATFSGCTSTISFGGATVKELNKWGM